VKGLVEQLFEVLIELSGVVNLRFSHTYSSVKVAVGGQYLIDITPILTIFQIENAAITPWDNRVRFVGR
jgi:hypothetical protein